MSVHRAVIFQRSARFAYRTADGWQHYPLRWGRHGRPLPGQYLVRLRYRAALGNQLVYQWSLTGGVMLSGWPQGNGEPGVPRRTIGLTVQDAAQLAQWLSIGDLIVVVRGAQVIGESFDGPLTSTYGFSLTE